MKLDEWEGPTLEGFEKELLEVGSKYDGHVTIGSFNEQLKLIRKLVKYICDNTGCSLGVEEVIAEFKNWPH